MASKNTTDKLDFSANSRNVVTIALVVLLIAASFLIGSLWTRVQSLEEKSGSGVAGVQAGDAQPTGGNDDLQAKNKPELTETEHFLGKEDAKIVLIEYSDLDCPFCVQFHPTANQIFEQYGGDVAWVYRHFPLEQLHPNAPAEAEASECVAELAGEEVFWSFIDKLYEAEITEKNSTAKLAGVASGLGVNQAQFTDCMESGKYESLIQSQYSTGVGMGVTGTPGNILWNRETGETRLIPGAQPLSVFTSAIDELLGS